MSSEPTRRVMRTGESIIHKRNSLWHQPEAECLLPRHHIIIYQENVELISVSYHKKGQGVVYLSLLVYDG